MSKESSIKSNNKLKKNDSSNVLKRKENCFKRLFSTTKNSNQKRYVYVNKFKDTTKNKRNISNKVKNQKYNWITIIPLVILYQFSFFSNQFYLALALTQFINVLKVGFLFSYVAPFVVVLSITLLKEIIDEYYRFKRDQQLNNEEYEALFDNKNNYNEEINKNNFTVKNECVSDNLNTTKIKSKDIRVGDIIILHKNQRVPADMILLKSFELNESCYIKTDQLDGETDWKLRKPSATTQKLKENFLNKMDCCLEIEEPKKAIYEFQGIMNIQFQAKEVSNRYSRTNFKADETIKKNINYSCFSKLGEKLINYEDNDLDIGNNTKQFNDPLGLENTLWANTVLASSRCAGIVIYIGKETRSRMNCTEANPKVGAVDIELNHFAKLLFVIMFICSLLLVFLKGFSSNIENNFITFFRFIVLLSSIIPISLRVNSDIAKTINSKFISSDKQIPNTICRNSTLPEELGRIEYIFTDKTGTLTKNEMIFRKLYTENELFENEKLNDIKNILESECKLFDAPMLDILEYNNKQVLNNNDISLSAKKVASSNLALLNKRKYLRIRNQKKVIRDAITAMCLCNCVTPITEVTENNYSGNSSLKGDSNSINVKNNLSFKTAKNNIEIESRKPSNEDIIEDNDLLNDTIRSFKKSNTVTTHNSFKLDKQTTNNSKTLKINETSSKDNKLSPTIKKTTFQASSPDEIALVEFGMTLNMKLHNRNDKLIEIINANNKIESYEILAEFPFTSESKRMGIILRNLEHNHIIFYMKGAESVIEQFVKEDKKSYVKDNAEQLAINGLRTLVLTQKLLSENFYNEWNSKYQLAKRSMTNRKQEITDVISLLEKDMEFLCVTGVEDLLQDDVNDTIESLRRANIRIWMLTGDKVETAKCIAISTGLKSKDQKEFVIANDKNTVSINEKLNNFNLKSNKDWILIIDGDCLAIALRAENEKIFFQAAMKAGTVVCCRCSPTQKAQIVSKIRKYTSKRTLAIGDGGNDVAMILQANLGVGVVGKEGMQASLAADYSIIKFSHLKRLLLWFGRISYKNTSNIAIFVIHRGLIISLMQMIFSIIFYVSAIPLYNGLLILGYTTAYTAIPVITLLYDREISNDDAIKFPDLYRELQKGRALNLKAFLLLTFMSVFQAATIMCGSIYLFDSKIFLNIVTITFSSLIIAELLNVYIEVSFI